MAGQRDSKSHSIDRNEDCSKRMAIQAHKNISPFTDQPDDEFGADEVKVVGEVAPVEGTDFQELIKGTGTKRASEEVLERVPVKVTRVEREENEEEVEVDDGGELGEAEEKVEAGESEKLREMVGDGAEVVDDEDLRKEANENQAAWTASGSHDTPTYKAAQSAKPLTERVARSKDEKSSKGDEDFPETTKITPGESHLQQSALEFWKAQSGGSNITSQTSESQHALTQANAEAAKAKGDTEKALEALKEALDDNGELKAEGERTKVELNIAADERDDWRNEAIKLRTLEEAKEAKAKEREIEQAKMNKKIIRKSVEVATKKNEQKLYDQAAAFDQKFEDLRSRFKKRLESTHSKQLESLNKKDELLRKTKATLMAKHQDDVDELKAQIAAMKEERKREKEEANKYKKTLKQEQQDEIKKHKPETSAALKESSEALKDKGKEIRKLQETSQTWKDRADFAAQEVVLADQKRQDLEQVIKNLREEKQDLSEKLTTAETDLDHVNGVAFDKEEETTKKHAEITKSLQLQIDTTTYHAKTADEHRRTTFVLRQASERKDKAIASLEAKVGELKDELQQSQLKLRDQDNDVHDLKGRMRVKDETLKNMEETLRELKARVDTAGPEEKGESIHGNSGEEGI